MGLLDFFRRAFPDRRVPRTGGGGEPFVQPRPEATAPVPRESTAAANVVQVPFSIEWRRLPADQPLSLERPALLICGGPAIPGEIESLQATLESVGRSLAVIAPSPAASFRGEPGKPGVAFFEASDLPGQPVTALLEDVAVFSGAAFLSKDLGWGLDIAADRDYSPLVMPALSGFRPEDMGHAQRLEYDKGQLTLTGGGGSSAVVGQRIAALLRTSAAGDLEAAGLGKRLERLRAGPAEVRRAPSPSFERAANVLRIPSGFRSPYLITDARSMEARLDGPRVLVSRRPLTDWRDMAALLQPLAGDTTPVLIVVPELSDEAIAVLVVNKLRGLVNGLAVEVRDDAWAEEIADFTQAGPAPQPFDAAARLGRTLSVVCDAHSLSLLK